MRFGDYWNRSGRPAMRGIPCWRPNSLDTICHCSHSWQQHPDASLQPPGSLLCVLSFSAVANLGGLSWACLIDSNPDHIRPPLLPTSNWSHGDASGEHNSSHYSNDDRKRGMGLPCLEGVQSVAAPANRGLIPLVRPEADLGQHSITLDWLPSQPAGSQIQGPLILHQHRHERRLYGTIKFWSSATNTGRRSGTVCWGVPPCDK